MDPWSNSVDTNKVSAKDQLILGKSWASQIYPDWQYTIEEVSVTIA